MLGFTAKRIYQLVSKESTNEIIGRKFLLSSKTTSFINTYHHELPRNYRLNKATGTRLPDDPSAEVPNDGFIEIDGKSFINSSMTINDLFNQTKLDMFQVKCNKEGHARYLDRIHNISIDDTYIHHEEKLRIETILKINKPNHTFINEPIKKRDERYQQRTNNLLVLF